MSTRLGPDELLTGDDFPSLNAAFYRAEPADYFDRRLVLLLLTAGNTPGVEELLNRGVTYENFSFPADQISRAEPWHPERFVTTETVVLLHHLGETLIRLYLGHEATAEEGVPPCPWLDLARVRTPGLFKMRARERFLNSPLDTAERRRRVALAFYGAATTRSFEPRPAEREWTRSLDSIESHLVGFANELLDGGALYNAAKHGLALGPEHREAEFKDLASSSGPSIEYLEVKRDDDRDRWYRTVDWVNIDLRLAEIGVGVELIRMLWNVARARYVLPRARIEHRLFDRPTYAQMAARDLPKVGGTVRRSSFKLKYVRMQPIEAH
jgi:hypothetical protein